MSDQPRRNLPHAALATLAAILLLLRCQDAMAAEAYKVLNENALQVADPAHVVLIGVGRAGNRLVAVGEQGVIIYSDDNGGNWKQAKVPVEVTLTSVGFATPEIGWAAGDLGVILRTTDGGATWTKQLTGAEVNQLQTQSASALAAANPADPAGQRAMHRASVLSAAGPDKPFFSIQALSPQQAIIFGAYRMAVATDDGGKTWRDLSLGVGDPVSHNLYDSIRIGSCIYIAAEAGMVFRAAPDNASFPALQSPTQTTLLGIISPAENVLLVYGVAGNMFRSADAGQSWAPVAIAEQSDLTAGAALQSGLDVVAAENGDLFVSTDHGANFNASPRNLGMGLFGVTQAANGNLVFVGTNGVRVLPEAALKPS